MNLGDPVANTVSEAGADFLADTSVEALEDSPGRFRANLSPEWAVWGPFGGYLAAIAMRAAFATSRLSRPASLQCQFIGACEFAPVELEVISLGGGRRAESLRIDLRQEGRLRLSCTIWLVADGIPGLEHDAAACPCVRRPENLKSYQDLTSDYAKWFPLWRNIEGRPTQAADSNLAPIWRTWLRLRRASVSDRTWDALRQVLWLDLPGWNAISSAHPRPPLFLGPNLDLTVQFHRFAPKEQWLLCEGTAPVATDGLAGSVNRIWSPDGCLLATGTLTHLFRPNPNHPARATPNRHGSR